MGIEISSGGVSKKYRYYPYDAFYVDANGNVNTSGNGQQVKEAWFNGVKYYPENPSGDTFVIRFFTDDFMTRDIPQRYFSEPDWIHYDAMLREKEDGVNRYLFFASNDMSGNDVIKVRISPNSSNFHNLQVAVSRANLKATRLIWERGDSTSQDGTYNPSRISYTPDNGYVSANGYAYKYDIYGENDFQYIQFMRDSNAYFLNRSLSNLILSKQSGDPEWYDILYNYKKSFEFYISNSEDPTKLIATYSYSKGFEKTSNYATYASSLGKIEPLFIETTLFDV